jgi:hypothetical protein
MNDCETGVETCWVRRVSSFPHPFPSPAPAGEGEGDCGGVLRWAATIVSLPFRLYTMPDPSVFALAHDSGRGEGVRVKRFQSSPTTTSTLSLPLPDISAHSVRQASPTNLTE